MRKSRYPHGCATGSQEPGDASSSDYVWIVNFNNGNVNNNHRNNKAFVRAVSGPSPAGECQGGEQGKDAATFSAMYKALQGARRNKRPSENQMRFEMNWADGLIDLVDRVNAGTWKPSPAACFIARRPKAREIHAPDFADRVVHHWLVPQLEAVYEPTFIHDSYANRRGKGTHAAVDRLKSMVRQVHSGQGGGWYLQLDVHNFFNSIHRPTLYRMLKGRLARGGLSDAAMRVVHALLRHPVGKQGVVHMSRAADRLHVPPHKRLENAPAGCGLPIGNLSSQFFANVYLDRLDQFVKHELKVPRYVRYVDDFVLVHRDRAVLEAWKNEIESFLGRELKLSLKDDVRLRPLTAGIDFLGYVVYPTHTLVRRRVLNHLHDALTGWAKGKVSDGKASATPVEYRELGSIWASYQGHMRHANAHRLTGLILRRHPWLEPLTARRRFAIQLEGRRVRIPYHGHKEPKA
jgi:retron-type reverse transcriptase